MIIRPASYTDICELKAPFVGHNPRTSYIAAFYNGQAVGACGYRVIRPGTIELCGDVVHRDYRKRGIYSALWDARERLLSAIPHKREVAYCTKYSRARYIAAGFVPQREYKNSTYMIKSINNGNH